MKGATETSQSKMEVGGWRGVKGATETSQSKMQSQTTLTHPSLLPAFA